MTDPISLTDRHNETLRELWHHPHKAKSLDHEILTDLAMIGLTERVMPYTSLTDQSRAACLKMASCGESRR